MKKGKTVLSIALVLALCLGLFITPVSAATTTTTADPSAVTDQATKAKVLWNLNLFKGYDNTGANFGLNDTATREQALVFLIRLLGEDAAASAWTGTTPYTDVPENSWAKPYIGYAKEKGYTQGIGNGQFGLGAKASQQQMATFALRGLGYSDDDSVKDFTYTDSITYAKDKGIIASDKKLTTFTRGNAVDILYGSVFANMKGKDTSLVAKLMGNGVVTQSQYDNAMAAVKSGAVVDAAVKNDLASGTYTMQCMGKYFYVNSGKLEIRDTTPAQIFTVTKKDGYTYIQTDDGKYLTLTAVTGATQLITGTTAYKWTIEKLSSGAYSIRPAAAQKMIVNANGESSANGTKMIIWESPKTQQNTKITIKAATPVTATTAAVTATFKIKNSTGRSINDLYFKKSTDTSFGSDFLTKNSYNALADGKNVSTSMTFASGTKYDFWLVYADGSEAKATGLEFTKAPSTGGTIELKANAVSLLSGTYPIASVNMKETKAATAVTPTTTPEAVTDPTTPAVTDPTTPEVVTEPKGEEPSVPPAPAAIDRNLKIKNSSRFTIAEIYAKSGDGDWSGNLISTNMVKAAICDVTFTVTEDNQKVDVRIVHDQGTELLFEDIDLSVASDGKTLYYVYQNAKPLLKFW